MKNDLNMDELKRIDPETLDRLDAVMDDLQGAMPAAELKELLETTRKGEMKQTLKNCVMVFRHDINFYGKIRYNLMSQRVDVIGKLPWKRTTICDHFTDSDFRVAHLYLEEHYDLRIHKRIDEAVLIVAAEKQYHPIRDYLNNLPPWDKTERVRYALHKYLGAEPSDYTYELLKYFMLGAVSRVFNPGVKYDYILCLVGGQGAGKSSFFRFLAVRDEWFCDDLKNLESEKVYEKMMGHWIIELAEMVATSNARTNEANKSFLSRMKETFRIPYEKFPEDRPRQCVFCGTTNKKTFLPNDRSGNRRFLPIQCDEEKAEAFILDDELAARAYFDQMWAEIMEIYRTGKFSLKLTKELEGQISEYQKAFTPEDADLGMILAFMQDTTEQRVCSKMLFREALKNDYIQPQRWQTNEICEEVNYLIRTGQLTGWRAYDSPKRFRNYGTQKGWERIPGSVNLAASIGTEFVKVPKGTKTPFD